MTRWIAYAVLAIAAALIVPLFALPLGGAVTAGDPERYGSECVSAEECDRAVRALLPVHLYGLMADMDSLNEIAVQYGLDIILLAASLADVLHSKLSVLSGDFVGRVQIEGSIEAGHSILISAEFF